MQPRCSLRRADLWIFPHKHADDPHREHETCTEVGSLISHLLSWHLIRFHAWGGTGSCSSRRHSDRFRNRWGPTLNSAGAKSIGDLLLRYFIRLEWEVILVRIRSSRSS